MPDFHFSIPIDIRYGDLDPQWHVNNARTVSLIEHGRLAYLVRLGLWDGKDFNALGLIVADVHVTYLEPLMLWESYRVDVRVSRLGNKSLTFEYQIVDTATGCITTRAETIMVAYDYNAHQSIPVPQSWRDAITAFEQ